MTLELNLSPELECRLRREAERQGLSPDALGVKLLEQHLPPSNRAAALIALLEQWQEEDEQLTDEECASNAGVLQSFDEDRLSDRKLFTNILKDEPA